MRRDVGYGLLAVACALVLALPVAVLAHVPALEPSSRSDSSDGSAARPYPEAHPIPGPGASRALYGILAADERYDAYRFRVTEKVTTTVGVLVPAEPSLAEYRPLVTVLIGNRILTDVPQAPERRETFFEPFSLETFYRSGEQAVTFTPGNDYLLLVEGGRGSVRSGRYVVTFSGPEAFSPGETARTILILPRIWLGLYGQAEPTVWPIVALVAAVVAAGIVLAVARRRRREGVSAPPSP